MNECQTRFILNEKSNVHAKKKIVFEKENGKSLGFDIYTNVVMKNKRDGKNIRFNTNIYLVIAKNNGCYKLSNLSMSLDPLVK